MDFLAKANYLKSDRQNKINNWLGPIRLRKRRVSRWRRVKKKQKQKKEATKKE
jgi:hypothetical protein